MEIKFRVWDNLGKEMLDSKVFKKPGETINSFLAFEYPYSDKRCAYIGWEETNLSDKMQYTGLKDKNGKEIYEGDICKNGDWEDAVHTYNYRIEVVEWDDNNACWIGWNPVGGGVICEIIGNIYENKKLFKEASECLQN